MFKQASTFLLLTLTASLAACSVNPTTGRSQFNALSREQEIAMGVQAKPEMTQQFGGEVGDAQLRGYITDLGRRLAQTTAQDDKTSTSLPWEFTLLNSDVINAFALPGGKIFVTRGLAARLTNEAQIAGVIGHEIGHVTARHINDRVANQMGAGIIAVAIGIGTGSKEAADAASQLGQVALLSYSRDEENEADELGMRYMSRLNYDPKGQQQVMQVLVEAMKGSARQPEFLSTHPYPEERVARIGGLLTSTYKFTQGNSQYQLFPDRYQTNFLARLRQLPPAPPPPKTSGADDVGDQRLALGNPTIWCAHCRAAALAQSH